MSRRRVDALAVFLVALVVRLDVVAWAANRIPPTADGVYYERIAERIARGLGYTWLWPDGAVTYAAHYPVGYPAAVGAIYALIWPQPVAAMILNALVGALAAVAAYALAARAAFRSIRVPLVAGLLVALHPGLVAYTPAVMTEGVTAALVILASAAAAWARDRKVNAVAVVGLILGIATLVRPQCLVLAPLWGALAGWRDQGRSRSRAAWTAAIVTAITLLVVAPWTLRNCVRMSRCAFVSVNGGWNLLIGADAESTGAWSPIKVPDACREVFDEAEKDACFGRAARGYVRDNPATWIALAPRKLAATFDYAGAAPWYLHEANPTEFPWRAKQILGGVETVYERVLVLAALAWGARSALRARLAGTRVVVATAFTAGVFAFTRHAWVSYLALGVVALLAARHKPIAVLPIATGLVILTTALTHAVFFGAGRYSLVVFPLVAALASLVFERDAEANRVA